MRLCSNVPAQAVVQTLGGHQVLMIILFLVDVFEREYVYKALCDIPGISAVKPKAAFFISLRLIRRSLISRMMSSLLWILREKNFWSCMVVVNWKDRIISEWFICLCIEVLEDAMGKLGEFWSIIDSKVCLP